MADYFGVAAIAKRMGVDPTTIRHWHRHRGFLMYHRWNNRTLRRVWYSNDALIFSWERAQCLDQGHTPKPVDQTPSRDTR